MLKKSVFTLSIFALIMTSACKKINDALTFPLTYTTKVSYPPSSVINLPIDILTPEITTNSQSEFSSRNTNANLIDKVTLKEMKMTITSPSDQRFDFLSSVEVYIQAPGLGELKIAEITNVPDNIGTVLNLTVAGNDLAPYIKKDKFTLRAKTLTDKATSKQINVDIFSQIEVKAKLL